MKTRIVKISPKTASLEKAILMGRMLDEGAVVAFPTETVYGLAASSAHPRAVQRLREIKERPADKPLTVHLADVEDLGALAAPLGPIATRLVVRLWPGPLTLVLPDRAGGLTGFRLPDSRIARAFLGASGKPVLATSANLAGRPPCVTGREVVRSFKGKVNGILAAGTTKLAAPSTVVRVEGHDWEILRPGFLTEDQVTYAACHTILFLCTGNLCRSPMAEGMLKTLLAERLGVPISGLPRRGFLIHSAGTGALDGSPPTAAACRVAADHGADIRNYVSRPLTPTLIETADEIFAVSAHHADIVLDYVPEANRRVRMLTPDETSIPDPYGKSEEEYRAVGRTIRQALEPVLERLVEMDREGRRDAG